MTSWLCHCVVNTFSDDFLWFTAVVPYVGPCIVFSCIPFFGVRVLHFGLPVAVHVHIYVCWLCHLTSFWAPTLDAKIVSCFLRNYHTFWLSTLHSSFDSLLPSILQTITWCMGSHLKIKTKIQDVLTYICRFILVMAVSSSVNYAKEITKEKNPKGHMQLIHVLTKLPSKHTESLHVLKSHWHPYRKALINKLCVLLSYFKISSNSMSCQTSSKMQQKWSKLNT